MIDRLIAAISPQWALKRRQARHALAYYDAAKTSNHRSAINRSGSGNTAVESAGTKLRDTVRELERNHDLVRGALNTLVAHIVGPTGISEVRAECRQHVAVFFDLGRSYGVSNKALNVATAMTDRGHRVKAPRVIRLQVQSSPGFRLGLVEYRVGCVRHICVAEHFEPGVSGKEKRVVFATFAGVLDQLGSKGNTSSGHSQAGLTGS